MLFSQIRVLYAFVAVLEVLPYVLFLLFKHSVHLGSIYFTESIVDKGKS